MSKAIRKGKPSPSSYSGDVNGQFEGEGDAIVSRRSCSIVSVDSRDSESACGDMNDVLAIHIAASASYSDDISSPPNISRQDSDFPNIDELPVFLQSDCNFRDDSTSLAEDECFPDINTLPSLIHRPSMPANSGSHSSVAPPSPLPYHTTPAESRPSDGLHMLPLTNERQDEKCLLRAEALHIALNTFRSEGGTHGDIVMYERRGW